MRLDETRPMIPYEIKDWYRISESERINELLNMISRLSIVTDRLVAEAVDHEDRIHTLELSSTV